MKRYQNGRAMNKRGTEEMRQCQLEKAILEQTDVDCSDSESRMRQVRRKMIQ